jgi:hypothetical protein
VKRLVVWFKNLSRVSRVSVWSSIALSGLFVASAMSPPPSTTFVAPAAQVGVKQEPVVTTNVESVTQPIQFEKRTIENWSLAKGTTQVQTAGVDGIRTITYTITLTDGAETNRTSSEAVTSAPITEVTSVGMYVKPASNCDSNYSGCVPIASDVDCAGGSGNGPAYVRGPVNVIGYDIYGLDRDGDGIGCE